jgi:two-component system KDP operon response regulator KdpE
MDECTARLKALTRRSVSGAPRESSFRFGAIAMYPERRSVVRDGVTLHFTRTEFNLLHSLAQRLDQLTPHRLLMSEVWGQEYLSARHYLRVYVRRVREKIEVDANRPELLIAYRAKGYMLRSNPSVGPVAAHAERDSGHRNPAIRSAASAFGSQPAPSFAG